MNKITITDKPVFTGEDITLYAEDVYLVIKDDGQAEFVIPNIEKYKITDGVKVDQGESGKVDLFCPNVRTLNHPYNQWSRVDEHTIECSECGCKMDIRNVSGRAHVAEVKE